MWHFGAFGLRDNGELTKLTFHSRLSLDSGTWLGFASIGVPIRVPRETLGQSVITMNHEDMDWESKGNEGALHASRGRGLVEVLRSLPKKEFNALVTRVDAAVDPAKRIDIPSQVARALLLSADLREPSRMGRPAEELMNRLAEAGGLLEVEAAPPGLEPLVARGLVYVTKEGGGLKLVLPIAFQLQMKSWPGEDRRSVRALLAQANPEVAAAIASHYLGRPVAPPVALALEDAWRILTTPELLGEQLQKLPPLERKLLHAVEEVGGEVDTEELLEMEREPVRLRGASGATPSRRGVGFALERRGFLIPVHPNRHVVPTEVARLVGAERLAEREGLRQRIRDHVRMEDYIPQRARFALDVTPLAMGLAMGVHAGEGEVRPGVGTPRSLISKMATRFGRPNEAIALVASLSRIAGLWDTAATSPDGPPGDLRLAEIGPLLFKTWRRGGAWDESRNDGELLRVHGDARESGAVSVVRSVVVEALQELGDGQWAPWGAIAEYMRADPRTPGLLRLLTRHAQKTGIDITDPVEIGRRMAIETLHVLGLVDLADADEGDGVEGPMLRITPRGRAWLAELPRGANLEAGRFIDNQTLRIGTSARVAEVLALHPLTEVGNVEGELDLIMTPRTLALAIGTGIDPSEIRERLEVISALPDPILRQLTQASTVLGRAEFVPCAGFIWIDDPEVRRMLSTRRSTADLFVNPSPPSGLLVAAGVDLDKLSRRCRTMGVEILNQGAVHYAQSVAPGRRRVSEPPGPDSAASSRLSRSGTRVSPASKRGVAAASRRGGVG